MTILANPISTHISAGWLPIWAMKTTEQFILLSVRLQYLLNQDVQSTRPKATKKNIVPGSLLLVQTQLLLLKPWFLLVLSEVLLLKPPVFVGKKWTFFFWWNHSLFFKSPWCFNLHFSCWNTPILYLTSIPKCLFGSTHFTFFWWNSHVSFVESVKSPMAISGT